MIEKLINVFSVYPIQTLGILIFFPIWVILLYESRYNRKNQLEQRVQSYLKDGKDEKMLEKAVRWTNDYLGGKGDTIQLKLQRANIPFRKEEYLSLLIIGVIAGAFIGFTLFPFAGVFKGVFGFISSPYIQLFFARVLCATVFAFLGYFVPEVYVKYLIFERKQLLDNQIEVALLQLADALRSGVGINTAFQLAADELKYPMKDEFSHTYQEISNNVPLIDSLDSLIKRVNLKDFTFAMNAIQIQSETGANLEELLRNIVKTVSSRKLLRKELQKAIAESKMTGYVMMAAPLVLYAMMTLNGAAMYGSLLKTSSGLVMIAVAVACYVIGAGLILKILYDVSKLS